MYRRTLVPDPGSEHARRPSGRSGLLAAESGSWPPDGDMSRWGAIRAHLLQIEGQTLTETGPVPASCTRRSAGGRPEALADAAEMVRELGWLDHVEVRVEWAERHRRPAQVVTRIRCRHASSDTASTLPHCATSRATFSTGAKTRTSTWYLAVTAAIDAWTKRAASAAGSFRGRNVEPVALGSVRRSSLKMRQSSRTKSQATRYQRRPSATSRCGSTSRSVASSLRET
jgi:hypothetical protein